MPNDFWGQIEGGYNNPAESGAFGSDPTHTIGTQRPDSNYWNNYFLQQFQQNLTPTQYQTANQDQARTEQQRVIQALQAQAAGDPNSLAQQQLANAYQGAQSQQSSLGSTMRGQSAGAAMRGIQAGQQNIQRSLPGDQQMLMLQEQQAAQSMLAQLLAQQQGQDITQAQDMAGAQLQGQSAIDAFYRQMFGGALDSGTNQQQTALAEGLASQGFDLEMDRLNRGFQQDLINAAATGTAAVGQAWGGRPSGSGYRQVDGQNSIVPEWDK